MDDYNIYGTNLQDMDLILRLWIRIHNRLRLLLNDFESRHCAEAETVEM